MNIYTKSGVDQNFMMYFFHYLIKYNVDLMSCMTLKCSQLICIAYGMGLKIIFQLLVGFNLILYIASYVKLIQENILIEAQFPFNKTFNVFYKCSVIKHLLIKIKMQKYQIINFYVFNMKLKKH